MGCPRIASVHLLRISGQWKFIESGQRMYIQKNKQRRGQSLFLSVARGEKPWVLKERSMVLGSTWQHLAAAPPQAHLSCTRDKKLARPATGRFGWLLGTKACTLAILHRQKIKSATVSHLPAPCFFLFAPRTADTKLASSCE